MVTLTEYPIFLSLTAKAQTIITNTKHAISYHYKKIRYSDKLESLGLDNSLINRYLELLEYKPLLY